MEVVHPLLVVIPSSFQCFLEHEILILRAIPAAIYEPKSSPAFFAMLIVLVIRAIKRTIIELHATKPISSPTTANIKSVVLGYKKPRCVCVPFNHPWPISLPSSYCKL